MGDQSPENYGGNFTYTEEQKREFRENLEAFSKYLRELENLYVSVPPRCIKTIIAYKHKAELATPQIPVPTAPGICISKAIRCNKWSTTYANR
jgi:hypothetical protein